MDYAASTKNIVRMAAAVGMCFYLALIFHLTIGTFSALSVRWVGQNINLEPFRVLQTIEGNPLNFYGNVLMFLPMGFLPVFMTKRGGSFWLILLLGLAVSCGIEFLQMFTLRATDVDDLILNTAGTLLGCAFGKICLFLSRKRKKRLCF